ncbi:PREDICTED: uncharacterized protein LOC108364481 [Rhagoletis zephyria]|uniref:uncharacterized protein LOC108364481 n=1 Tax=Rhagoletis zephyria TaxID=28612 RepID=UPI00081185A0|nr:PREDICTED: uncharacterized protein LOC108364481 [Rhagoletis zephyria]
MFLSLVHNNVTLTQVQKYFYLKGSCTGTPKEMVEEYPATNASYEPAWSALVNRYHNNRKLVDQILRKLFNVQTTDGRLHSIQQLLDITRNFLALLRTLEVDTSNWDPIIMFLLTQKIDKQTRKEWEQSLNGSNEIPLVKSFLKFLDSTYKALEFVEGDIPSAKQHKSITTPNKEFRRKSHTNIHTATTTNISDTKCLCCHRNHLLYKCFKFSAFSAADRKEFVKQNKLCINCLGKGHTCSNCTTTSRCKVCGESHHTLLHNDFFIGNSITNKNNPATVSPNSLSNIGAVSASIAKLHSLFTHVSTKVLLATVRIIVETPGRKFYFKALVDQGAQTSFISEDAAQLLRLKTRNINANVSGIGGSQSFIARKAVKLNLRSHYNYLFDLECHFLLLPKVTTYTPAAIEASYLKKLPSVFLADPNFSSPDKIDFIFGADLYCDILLSGMTKCDNGLLLQETNFGWMISGPIKSSPNDCSLSVNLFSLDDQLRLFWEQEDLIETRPMSTEEAAVEKHFLETHSRDAAGRYTVLLPFKRFFLHAELTSFSHTHFNALRRLSQLEKRFKLQPEFALLTRVSWMNTLI